LLEFSQGHIVTFASADQSAEIPLSELQRSMASQCFLSHYMHVGALILQFLFKLCIRARKTKKFPFQYISNI